MNWLYFWSLGRSWLSLSFLVCPLMSRCRLASLSNRLFPFVENSGNRDLDVVGLHNCCYLLRFHREKVQVCWSSLVKTNHMLHQEKCIHSHLNLCLLYEIVLAGATNLIIAVCLMWKAALGCCHTFDYSCLSYVESRAGCCYTFDYSCLSYVESRAGCCHTFDYSCSSYVESRAWLLPHIWL